MYMSTCTALIRIDIRMHLWMVLYEGKPMLMLVNLFIILRLQGFAPETAAGPFTQFSTFFNSHLLSLIRWNWCRPWKLISLWMRLISFLKCCLQQRQIIQIDVGFQSPLRFSQQNNDLTQANTDGSSRTWKAHDINISYTFCIPFLDTWSHYNETSVEVYLRNLRRCPPPLHFIIYANIYIWR